MNKGIVHVAIGLLLGLLAGLAIGHSMGQGATPAPPTVVGDLPGAIDNPTPAPAKDEQPQPVQPPAPRGGTLDDIIAAAEIPPIPSGDGVITGRVVDERGDPVPGVTITGHAPYPADRGLNLPTAKERVAARIRYEKWVDAARWEAASGADGSYEITGLALNTDYTVAAALQGWQITKDAMMVQRHQAGSVVNFTARPSFELRVTVTMFDGSVAGSGGLRSRAAAARPGGFSGGSYANGAGTMTLTEGEWVIWAVGGPDEIYKSDEVTVSAKRGEALQPVTLQLKSNPGILGRVTTHAFYKSQTIYARLVPDPPPEPPAKFADDGRRGGDVRTRNDVWISDNVFKFTPLEPGRYRVLLLQDSAVVAWEDVNVADGIVELSMEIGEPDRADYIVVRAYGPDGKAVVSLSVSLSVHSGNNTSSYGSASVRREDNSHWIRKRGPRGDGATGWYSLYIKSDEYGDASVRYEAGDTHDVEVRFQSPAFLTLTVPGFNEHPDRMHLAYRLATSDRGRPILPHFRNHGDTPTPTSPFKMGPVEPGEYELLLEYRAGYGGPGASLGHTISKRVVTLAAGENELSLSVPQLYKLVVKLDSARGRAGIRSADGTIDLNAWAFDAKDGVITMSGLPAGEYTVHNDSGEMKVSIPAQSEVAFEPRPFDCIVMTFELESGIGDFGFLSGDKIISIDGVEVGSLQGAYAVLESSITKKQTTWTVLRSGLSTDVTFDGTALMKKIELEEGRRVLDLKPGFRVD